MGAIIDAINRRMHGVGCPTPGCLGECPALDKRDATKDTPAYYIAHLCLWDKNFNDAAQVASWFYELGAEWVIVRAVLHDKDNDIEASACTLDGVRFWDVSFKMRETAGSGREDWTSIEIPEELASRDEMARVSAALGRPGRRKIKKAKR